MAINRAWAGWESHRTGITASSGMPTLILCVRALTLDGTRDQQALLGGCAAQLRIFQPECFRRHIDRPSQNTANYANLTRNR